MFKRLRNLFKRKKKVEAPKVVAEPVVSDSKEDSEYVYGSNELTLYDCVIKSKQLGLDMRKINGKISSMGNKEFISWFKLTYLEK